jgi:hypothetical protein
MKKDHSRAFDDFFLEIPATDYLNDIEIQDEYETPSDAPHGLSDEQVSQIATDLTGSPINDNQDPGANSSASQSE